MMDHEFHIVSLHFDGLYPLTTAIYPIVSFMIRDPFLYYSNLSAA